MAIANSFIIKMLHHIALIDSNSPEFLQKAKNFFSTFVVGDFENSSEPEHKYFINMARGNIYKNNLVQEKPSFLKTLSSIDEMIIFLLHILDNESLGKKRKDYLFLHASAVAFNKNILLFPADFSCGKTTIALSLVLNGAKYIADDLVIINPENLEIHPFLLGIHIDNRTLTLFPDLKNKANGDFYFKFPNQKRGKNYYLPPNVIRKESTLNENILVGKTWKTKLVIFPKYSSQLKANVIKNISKPKVVLELIKNTNNLLHFELQDSLIEIYASLISEAQCFYFERTDPIEKAAETILQLL